jgi:mannose-6-phosphate isomerase-like protein (cupin superfamily)
MKHTLATAAAPLDPWRSTILARIGGAKLKVLRMDDRPYGEETHAYDEGLLVVDGLMRLAIGGAVIDVGAGELYLVPAGTPHAVAPGSRGTLVIVEA